MLQPHDFFDLSDSSVAQLFEGCDYVWQALTNLETSVKRLVNESRSVFGEVMEGAYLSDRAIYIDRDARIEPGAYILGPAYIGQGAVVRHGAFIRENVIMLAGSVLGHASEAKQSIMLPGAHAPHFNYLGDSIIGAHTNLGAGTKLSNLTMMSVKDPRTGKRPTIRIVVGDRQYDTGLAKMGAILGDSVQTGCNAVLNPGCLVGPRTLIYANVSLRKGFYGPDCILKLRQAVEGYKIR
ncbi:MAG TPA: glucose-1-phosphate thymidylyltransferase [candidate division Zixibacteria bacterium]|nr:glucose-1-phosphate thymidylyltransferase [candidate division Zixibacteria bacterium]